MQLKQILLLALIVSWLRQTKGQTMSVIELSWTAKNDAIELRPDKLVFTG